MRRLPGLLAGLAMLGGCLFRAPDAPRFFRPGSVILDAAAEDGAEPPAKTGIAFRLRGVHSAPFLLERIVWRASEVEYGLYAERRWIDLPANYVERALRTRIRETPGLRLTDDARAPALHVDVLAFDDVVAPTRAANVVLGVRLADREEKHLLERRFDARVAIADADPASMAKAMGQALDDVVAQVAEAVRSSLQDRLNFRRKIR